MIFTHITLLDRSRVHDCPGLDTLNRISLNSVINIYERVIQAIASDALSIYKCIDRVTEEL